MDRFPPLAILALLLFPASALAGAFTELPRPPDAVKATGLAVDDTGAPVVLAKGRVLRFVEGEWRELNAGAGPLVSGMIVANLHGDADRGLFLTQPGTAEHRGLVYRITDGEVRPAGDFYYDAAHWYPGLYMSRSGDLFNYSTRYVGVREEKGWRGIEVPLQAYRRRIVAPVDFGPDGPVVFLSRTTGTVCIYEDGQFRRTELPAPLRANLEGDAQINACRLGADRILLWRWGYWQFAALRLEDGQLVREDVSEMLKELRGEVHDGWTAPDGSAWLLLRVRGGYAFARVSPKGEVERISKEETAKLGWENREFAMYPGVVAADGEGSLWLGLNRLGIARIRNGVVERFGWEAGVESRAVNWLSLGPKGTLYACGTDGRVYRWDPEAPAATVDACGWEEYVDLARNGPVPDPEGRLWVFRHDRAGVVSRWDGEAWTGYEIPFDPKRTGRLIADDTGHLIVAMSNYPDGTFIVGPSGTVRLTNDREAIRARVDAGAKRFRGRGYVGPVVGKDGRIWFSYAGYDRFSGCFDGTWNEFALRDVLSIVLAPDGVTPWFATPAGWWVYDAGRLELRHPAREDAQVFLIVDDARYPHAPMRFCPGLPEFLRKRCMPLTSRGGEGYAPIGWEEAARLCAGGEYVRPEALRDSPIRRPESLLRDRRGRVWVKESHGRLVRVLGERLIRADGRGTPLYERQMVTVGSDPKGGVWVDAGYYGQGRHVFLRPPGPDFEPRVEVVRGRSLRIDCRGKDLLAVTARLGPKDVAVIEPGAPLVRRYHRPGRRSLTVTLRPVDTLGFPGPARKEKVELDVRLPALEWAGGGPGKHLGEPWWRVPVEVSWAYGDVPHRVEYRIYAEGAVAPSWTPLPEDRLIPLAPLCNRSVRFEVRPVEEDEFHGEALSARFAVEFGLEKWIDHRIDGLLAGDETAVRDLELVPEAAVPRLEARLAEVRGTEKKLLELLRALTERRHQNR